MYGFKICGIKNQVPKVSGIADNQCRLFRLQYFGTSTWGEEIVLDNLIEKEQAF